MGIMDKLGLSRKPKMEEKAKTKINSDDSYIEASPVYNYKLSKGEEDKCDQLMILIQFTQDYFHEAIEFLSVAPAFLKVKYVHSSYDEDSGEKDTHDDPIYIIHNKYYILISGSDIEYNSFITGFSNLANEFIRVIYGCITNCRERTAYLSIIEYMPYDNTFVDIDKIVYDPGVVINGNSCRYIHTDIKLVMSRLPKAFSTFDMPKFINIRIQNYQGASVNYYTLSFFIHYALLHDHEYKQKLLEDLNDLVSYITNGDTSIEKLRNIIGPAFLLQDDDAIPGDITDEGLDDLFRQQYDRFSAVSDSNIIYQEIDENIANDAETENMRVGDEISTFDPREVFDRLGEETDI